MRGEYAGGDAVSIADFAILGWAWLGEALTVMQALGGVIVLAGIMVARRASATPA